MEFLKNMFSKPVVLWTAGEQLVMTAFVILGLMLIAGGLYLTGWIICKIEEHKRRKGK